MYNANTFLDDLTRMGRLGGAALIAIGIGLLAAGATLLAEDNPSEERPLSMRERRHERNRITFLVVVCIAGGMAVIGGAIRVVKGAPPEPMERQELIAALGTAPRPFTVCPSCLVLWRGGSYKCKRCGNKDTVDVDSEESAERVRSRLGV